MLDPVYRAEGMGLPPGSREITIPVFPAPQSRAVCVWDVKVCMSLAVSVASVASMLVAGAYPEPGGVAAMAVMAGFAARSTVRYLRIRVR